MVASAGICWWLRILKSSPILSNYLLSWSIARKYLQLSFFKKYFSLKFGTFERVDFLLKLISTVAI